ncbi:hypothetical protein [Tardiphaga sp. 709]|uniref:hypothetical protein n=1 Tax=Tardiphaga sp. 709 TaxID=3076039 RepID=UPI0028E32974|nr:hypothetical protein [Tardiphaga sp. 709]WNV09955.1 hypothetical protein RSO67_01800 [Tardiphaga sp. 709]
MNILQIVQTAANELGLVSPTTLVNSTDLQVIQLLALANRDCTSLYRDYDWTDLQEEHIVNVEAQAATTGDVALNSALILNIPSTAGLDTSWAVSGEGMPQAQRIAEVVDATTVRCEMFSTATALGTEILFAKDTYDLPTDFDRYIGQTWWDRTNHWRLIGPDSPQMDQYIRSGIFATGPRRRFRQVGRKPNAWRIWPPPFAGGAPAPGALVWEYISKNWVLKVDGTTSDRMTTDTDTPLLDDQLVIMGVKWRMWQIKGFEYAAMQQEYLDAVNAKFASDGGIPDLYLNQRSGPFLISNGNVRDGNFPGPT